MFSDLQLVMISEVKVPPKSVMGAASDRMRVMMPTERLAMRAALGKSTLFVLVYLEATF